MPSCKLTTFSCWVVHQLTWPVLKSYFLSMGDDKVAKLIWKFVAPQQDAETHELNSLPEVYMYFVLSVMSLTSSLKHLESNYLQPTLEYKVFSKLKAYFTNRQKRKFFSFKATHFNLKLLPYHEQFFLKETCIVEFWIYRHKKVATLYAYGTCQ